jgi:hypothetical protein
MGHMPYFADFNGDGKTDIFWDKIDGNGRSLGQRQLWMGKGDGTFTSVTNLAGQDGMLSGYRAYMADFNGDGLTDVLWVQETGGTPGGNGYGSNGISGWTGGARVLWIGKGDGTFAIVSNFAGQDGTVVGYTAVLGDFTGDGKADILWDSRTGTDTRSTGSRVLWLSDGTAPDLLTSITTGIGANVAVTYKPLTSSSVYTKDNTAIDPLLDLQGPMFVVSRVDSSNGIGGTVSSTYAYSGAKADLNGRGFLGFRQMTIADLQTNVTQTVTNRQDFPFTGLVASDVKKLGTTTLNATINRYAATQLGGTRYQVSIAQAQVASADLDGSVLPTATSTYQHDGYNNPTQIVVAATDGFSKTTSNTYTNDATNWLLGRLTGATVTSMITTPGAPPAQQPVQVVISSSANNLNLWDYLVSAGLATAGTPSSWTVTIASGVVIGSASTSQPAFDTGVFPSGSSLSLINNGMIVGAGGSGGKGAVCGWSPAPATVGGAGGTALRAQTALSVTNNASVWGGGGGGGGGCGGSTSNKAGNGGGGGAGQIEGPGGLPGDATGSPGGAGTLAAGGSGGTSASGGAGGAGGGPGLAGTAGGSPISGCYQAAAATGAAGGPAGAAASGNSLITWVTVGDRRGPLN